MPEEDRLRQISPMQKNPRTSGGHGLFGGHSSRIREPPAQVYPETRTASAEHSSDRQQHLAFGNRIAFLNLDAGDDTRARSLNRNFHLHGFHDDEDVAARNLVSDLEFNLPD